MKRRPISNRNETAMMLTFCRLSSISSLLLPLFTMKVSSIFPLFVLVGFFMNETLVFANKDKSKNNKARLRQNEVMTTLVNFDESVDLSPEEAAFLDTVWIAAYNSVNKDKDITVVEAEVKDKKHRSSDKHLRGRSLRYLNIYDILMFIRYHCELCWDDPNRALRKSKKHSSGKDHRDFELLLRNMLRAGPYKVFHEIEDCKVTFGDE